MAAPRFLNELRRRHVFRVAIAYAVTAWLLLQLAAIVLPTFGAPHWVLKVLIGVFVILFPVAILLAWAFEVTPEGVRRTESAESEVARPAGYRRHVGRVLNISIIVVLAAAVGLLAWQRFGAESGAQAVQAGKGTAIPAKSIAVLPFENLSEDKKNGYFANGMQDLILTKLADIGDLKVISRTSTMQYGSHPQNLKQIGRELGVATLLEGSVQKAGDQVLINVQLINARSDAHIWANTYQRTLNNIFGVEGEVAAKIAVALKARLDPQERERVAAVPTHNPAAYDAYLRGLSIETNTSDISTVNLEKVAAYYEQAVKLDPGFALAWARLSSADSNVSFSEADPARLARAKAALDHALDIAPDAAATLIAKGDYAYYGHLDYPKALAAYRGALRVTPNNATALVNMGFVERRQGHFRAALDSMERSLALDPHNVITLSNMAFSYIGLGDVRKARELLRRALAISPNDAPVASLLASTYQIEGNLAQAGKILTQYDITPRDWQRSYKTVLGQALYMRRYADAVRLARKALETSNVTGGRSSYYLFLGFAEHLAGNREASLNAYRQAVKIIQSRFLSKTVQTPTWGYVYANLALAQSGLGEKESALATSARAVELLSTSRDAFSGPSIQYFRAVVQANVGEKTQAVKTLRYLLAMPRGSMLPLLLTPALLRLDPSWDPLRKDPDFKALLKQYPWHRPVSDSTAAPSAGTGP